MGGGRPFWRMRDKSSRPSMPGMRRSTNAASIWCQSSSPRAIAPDSALMPSLLTLSDVLGTGYHAAFSGGVTTGSTVTVIGDGAVGLLAVLSARLLGAEQIILMGRYRARTDLGREFGATDVVSARGQEGIELVRQLTGGQGTRIVLEAVGTRAAYDRLAQVDRPEVWITLRPQDEDMQIRPWSDPENFNAGYVMRSQDILFKQGDHEPWIHMLEHDEEVEILPKADLDDGSLVYS